MTLTDLKEEQMSSRSVETKEERETFPHFRETRFYTNFSICHMLHHEICEQDRDNGSILEFQIQRISRKTFITLFRV